jgi:hypothetical protein
LTRGTAADYRGFWRLSDGFAQPAVDRDHRRSDERRFDADNSKWHTQ